MYKHEFVFKTKNRQESQKTQKDKKTCFLEE